MTLQYRRTTSRSDWKKGGRLVFNDKWVEHQVNQSLIRHPSSCKKTNKSLRIKIAPRLKSAWIEKRNL